MPTLTIKGLPDAVYRRIKERAERHRRSLNSEIIVCLEEATNLPVRDPKRWLLEADEIREEFKLTPLTDEMLREIKGHGRP